MDRVLALLGARNPEDVHLGWIEESHILRVLTACDGDRSMAAAVLGIARRTLQRKLRGPKLDPAKWRASNLLKTPSRARKADKAPGRRGPVPRIDGALVLDLRARQVPWAEIAQRLGCSSAGAALAAKRALRAGRKTRRKWGRINAVRVVAMRSDGHSWAQIARDLGCSQHGARLAAERLRPDQPTQPTASPASDLARRVGCEPSQLPDLFARLPDSPPQAARRRQALELRFVKGLSFAEVAAHVGVGTGRARQIVDDAIKKVIELRRGRGSISGRLKNIISAQVGNTDWTLDASAWALECSRLLRSPNMGTRSLAELHAHMRGRGLTMRCGCPNTPCATALARRISVAPPDVPADLAPPFDPTSDPEPPPVDD